MREYQIAAIGGDGIGTEVIEEGIRVIQAIANRYNAFKIEVSTFPWVQIII